jgi:hypothetical protein
MMEKIINENNKYCKICNKYFSKEQSIQEHLTTYEHRYYNIERENISLKKVINKLKSDEKELYRIITKLKEYLLKMFNYFIQVVNKYDVNIHDDKKKEIDLMYKETLNIKDTKYKI